MRNLTYDRIVKDLDLYQKVALAQRLLLAIADDEIGRENNPHLCDWLSRTASELEERCE